MAESIQYIYLLQEREFIKCNENVYKIGKTMQNNSKRFGQYPKNSNLLAQLVCVNCHKCETYIKKVFMKKYKQRKDIGTEYFEGDYNVMIDDIFTIIKIINGYVSNDKSNGDNSNLDNIIIKKCMTSINLLDEISNYKKLVLDKQEEIRLLNELLQNEKTMNAKFIIDNRNKDVKINELKAYSDELKKYNEYFIANRNVASVALVNNVASVNNIVAPVNNIVAPVNNIVAPVNNVANVANVSLVNNVDNVIAAADVVATVNNVVAAVNNLECPKCKGKFKYKSYLERHMNCKSNCIPAPIIAPSIIQSIEPEFIQTIIPPIPTSSTPIPISNPKMYKCKTCTLIFLHRQSLYNHNKYNRCKGI